MGDFWLESLEELKGRLVGQIWSYERIDKLKKDMEEGIKGNTVIKNFHDYLLTTSNPRQPRDALLEER